MEEIRLLEEKLDRMIEAEEARKAEVEEAINGENNESALRAFESDKQTLENNLERYNEDKKALDKLKAQMERDEKNLEKHQSNKERWEKEKADYEAEIESESDPEKIEKLQTDLDKLNKEIKKANNNIRRINKSKETTKDKLESLMEKYEINKENQKEGQEEKNEDIAIEPEAIEPQDTEPKRENSQLDELRQIRSEIDRLKAKLGNHIRDYKSKEDMEKRLAEIEEMLKDDSLNADEKYKLRQEKSRIDEIRKLNELIEKRDELRENYEPEKEENEPSKENEDTGENSWQNVDYRLGHSRLSEKDIADIKAKGGISEAEAAARDGYLDGAEAGAQGQAPYDDAPINGIPEEEKEEPEEPTAIVPPKGKPQPPRTPEPPTKPIPPVKPKGPKGYLPPVEPKPKDIHPIRSFDEILAETDTVHCGTILRGIHHLAKSPFFKSKSESTVGNILSVVPNTLMVIPRLVAKGINKVAGTDEKYQELYENIQRLSAEEFAVLTGDAEDINEFFGKKIKEGMDSRYLNSTTMKQRKVNNLYLDAVLARYKAEREDLQSVANSVDSGTRKRIAELRGKGELTDKEKEELEIAKELQAYMVGAGDKAADEIIAFEEGAKAKDGLHNAIRGSYAGKYNPDNIEFNQQIAGLAKRRNELLAIGEVDEAEKIDETIRQLEEQQTEIKGYHLSNDPNKQNKNNVIDSGLTSVAKGQRCETIDRGQKTGLRNFLRSLALGTAAYNVFESVQNQQMVDDLIDQQNADIEHINASNTDIPYEADGTQISDDELRDAAEYVAGSNVAGAHTEGEYGNLDEYAAQNGGDWAQGMNTSGYRVADNSLHENTTNTMNEVRQDLDNGDYAAAVGKATGYYRDVQQSTEQGHADYQDVTGNRFDYSGYDAGKNLADDDGANALTSIFEKISQGQSLRGTVTGTMKSLIDKVDLNKFSGVPLLGALGAMIVEARNRETQVDSSVQDKINRETQAKIETKDEGER